MKNTTDYQSCVILNESEESILGANNRSFAYTQDDGAGVNF